nr:MAG TPA: hypothetical protein [Caudoviricetes sp.]
MQIRNDFVYLPLPKNCITQLTSTYKVLLGVFLLHFYSA